MIANQIYHTSHCGSTLLSAMLSPVFDVYTEPTWSHRIVQGLTDDYALQINKYAELDVVKLPSGLCHHAAQTDGKKVFIYRKLRPHLMEMFLNGLHYQVDYYFDSMFFKNKHPELEGFNPVSLAEKHCFLWVNRILWMRDAQDVFWLEANSYFLAPVERTKEVAEYFGSIDHSEVKLIVRDVKELGCNHNDTPLRKGLADERHGAFRHPATAIMYDEVVGQDDGITQLADWLTELVPSVPLDLI